MSPWNSTFTKPGKPLARKSPKRVIEDREWADVKREALERDEWSCQTDKASTGVIHMGEIDVHHVVTVARDKTLRLEPTNLVSLCRRHHDWIHDNPGEATKLGLLRSAVPSPDSRNPQ